MSCCLRIAWHDGTSRNVELDYNEVTTPAEAARVAVVLIGLAGAAASGTYTPQVATDLLDREGLLHLFKEIAP